MPPRTSPHSRGRALVNLTAHAVPDLDDGQRLGDGHRPLLAVILEIEGYLEDLANNMRDESGHNLQAARKRYDAL
jgi:hypothetical protein